MSTLESSSVAREPSGSSMSSCLCSFGKRAGRISKAEIVANTIAAANVTLKLDAYALITCFLWTVSRSRIDRIDSLTVRMMRSFVAASGAVTFLCRYMGSAFCRIKLLRATPRIEPRLRMRPSVVDATACSS